MRGYVDEVVIEKLFTGTSQFAECGVAPWQAQDVDAMRDYLRSEALTKGGEAWRAVTDDGSVVCVYSVYDRANELRGTKAPITLHPYDQLCLAIARVQLGVTLHS